MVGSARTVVCSAQWNLVDSGVFDPTNVTGVEIHQDTWDYGFTVYYDGIHFAQRDPNSLPPAGPTPPPGVNPNAISPRVLLYVFDPIMENKGGVRMHQAYNWDDPVALSNQVVSEFNTNSHGLLQYNIVDTIIADVHPYYNNGFQYTDEGFDVDWLARDFSKTTSMFDYIRSSTRTTWSAASTVARSMKSGSIQSHGRYLGIDHGWPRRILDQWPRSKCSQQSRFPDHGTELRTRCS